MLVVAGLFVGITVGLTGMGGGALLTPLLIFVAGVPARAAISSDLVVALVLKPVGAIAHHRRGAVRRDVVTWLAAGSVPGAFGGAALGNLVLGDSSWLERCTGGMLLLAAGLMVMTVARGGGTSDTSKLRRLPTVLIGLVGGVIVGITSVGSGSLILVLLAWIYPSIRGTTLVGTDLAQAVPLVAAAAVGHLLFGEVRIDLVVPLLAGALPGVWIGAQLIHRLPERAIRPVLASVLTASGLRLLRLV